MFAEDATHLPHDFVLATAHDDLLLFPGARAALLLFSIPLPLEVVLNEKEADNADHQAAEDGPEEIHLRALAPAEVANVLRCGAGEFLDYGNQETRDERVTVRQLLGQVADFLDVLQPVVGDASSDRGPYLVVPAVVGELHEVEFAALPSPPHSARRTTSNSPAPSTFVPVEVAHLGAPALPLMGALAGRACQRSASDQAGVTAKVLRTSR